MSRKVSGARLAAYNHGALFGWYYAHAADPEAMARQAAEFYAADKPRAEFLNGATYGLQCRANGRDITSGKPLAEARPDLMRLQRECAA